MVHSKYFVLFKVTVIASVFEEEERIIVISDEIYVRF